jgi:hypothetical protein
MIMKRASSSWIIVLIAIVAGTSLADVNRAVRKSPPRPRNAVEIAIPVECQQFLAIPADSTSELLPWAQRLSIAACRQSISLAPVTDAEQFPALVASLDQAMAPSIEIYRDAMARGPTEIKILAAFGLGMTNRNIIVRARGAVRVPDGAFGGAAYGTAYIELSRKLHRALEQVLVKNRNAALAAFQEVARLAQLDPGAARANQVMPVVIDIAQTEAALLR